MPLALLVGAGAGGGAVGFRDLITFFTRLFTGTRDYSLAGHAPSPHFGGLGIYFVVLVPVIGGLVYGPIVDRFAKEARGHGVPEVMFAVAERGGRISPAVAVVKSLASALCIGSGGSVGREGPIVQVGSALGSTFGQLLHLSETRLRLLVACGAAGGISATFNAPSASNGYVWANSDRGLPAAPASNHLTHLTTGAIDCSGQASVLLSFQSLIGVFDLDASTNVKVRMSTDMTTWSDFSPFPCLITGAAGPPCSRWSANPSWVTPYCSTWARSN